MYELLEDSPHFGVWFSMDDKETYLAGVRVGLAEIQRELYPHTIIELAILIPASLDIGHA